MLLRCSKGSQPCPIRRPSLHDLHSRKFLGWVTGGTEESWLDAKSPEGGQARWTPRTSCLCRLSSFGGAVSIRGCPHPNAAPPGPGAPIPWSSEAPPAFIASPPLTLHLEVRAVAMVLRCAAFPWASANLFVPSSTLGNHSGLKETAGFKAE